MTPAQCRETRRLLGWKQVQLAAAANTSVQLIGAFERIGRVPRSRMGADRRAAIKATLEEAGVEFVGDVKVRLAGED